MLSDLVGHQSFYFRPFFFFFFYKIKGILTTAVLRLDITGLYTGKHLLDCCLQADISKSTSFGSVATFTSDSPLAQAEEPTSHMKENTTVTTKSYKTQIEHCRFMFDRRRKAW